MRDADGYPCGLSRNERLMSSTVMALRYQERKAMQTAYMQRMRATHPEKWNERSAEYKQARKAKRLEKMLEQFGYAAGR